MKRFSSYLFIFFTAISWVLHAVGATVQPYSGSRIFWDETTRKVVFAGGGYARVLRLQDKRLMAVCESNGIQCAFSSDNGATWTSPQLIAPNPSKISECVPDLIQLRDGTIIVAYNPRPHEPYSEDRKFGIRCRRSTNNGKSWSSEIFINDAKHTFADGCWEPSLLELPSGELQVYFADEGPYTTNNDQQISLCRSMDGGKTWGSAEKISYRAGHRDGMPVPILLQDQSDIVVIIEDNGQGYGGFFPTTVRTTLSNNWSDGYVDANSSRRAKALDLDYCKPYVGGAPYLRQMPNGETVMSYQSDYRKGGIFQMVTAVGDAAARGFKAMSRPFAYVEGENIMWNSVSPIDTNIVMAVGGVAGKIEVVKGTLMQHFACPYSTPKVDGRFTAQDKYQGRATPQIHMGNELGFYCQSDFAYDNDSLYFVARVYDKTFIYTGENQDGIRLFIESKGQSTNRVTTAAYQYSCRLDGTFNRLYGQSTVFKAKSGSNAHFIAKRSTGYYSMEIAIPWSDFGLTEAPTERMPRVNIEFINVDKEGNTSTEAIPDARKLEPWTWMPLALGENPTSIEGIKGSEPNVQIFLKGDKMHVVSAEPLKRISIYNLAGQLCKSIDTQGKSAIVQLPKEKIILAAITKKNGITINKKIRITGGK